MADEREENFKRAILALAVLYGIGVTTDPEDYAKLTDAQIERLTAKLRTSGSLVDKVRSTERITERDLQREAAKIGIDDGAQWYRIVGTKDSSTCRDCAEWQGRTVSMTPNDEGKPTVQDFIDNHGFHPNCRCSLQELTTDEIPLGTEINPRYGTRKRARPDLYNSAPGPVGDLVFN